MRHTPTTLIVGAGIAGLASALLASRERRVVVVEGEPVSFGHSSGRNAAIFRPLESSVCISELVLRSEHLFGALAAPSQVLDRRGLILAGAADSAALQDLSLAARELAVSHQLLDRGELVRLQGALRGGSCEAGLYLPRAGVLDIDVLEQWLRQTSSAHGVQLRTGAMVAEIRRDSGRVRGVTLASGEQLDAEQVVIAAGAWSEPLGASCDCPLPVRPHRRHLMTYHRDEPLTGPVAWDVDDNVYFRPGASSSPAASLRHSLAGSAAASEGGHAVLACPGDETPHRACVPDVDPALVETFPQRLAQFAPELGITRLVRAWACLRTSTPDGHPIVGADPRLDGLFWLAGLGGVGMSAGLGCAQHLASALHGARGPQALLPERWLAEGRSPLAQAGV